MSRRRGGFSLAYRVQLYFAFAPEEYLTPEDIAIKWKVDQRAVSSLLGHSVTTGKLARTEVLTSRGTQPAYKIGQQLRELVAGMVRG